VACSKDINHAFDVVGHDGKADFCICTLQSAQQEARMAEDLIFESGEGVFHRASSQSHFVRCGTLPHAVQNIVVKVARQ